MKFRVTARSPLLLGLVILKLLSVEPHGARADDVIYRFPDLHNPNPFAGRLYHQPIGAHDDQVIEGLRVDVSVNSYSEFNRRFHDGRYGTGKYNHNQTGEVAPDLLFMNGNTFQLMLSQGFKIRGLKIEAGAVVRAHVDRENSEMQVFLAKFHAVQNNSPGHIPPEGQPWNGTLGDQQTVAIGQDGQVYLTTLDLYTKLQVFEEKEWIPQVAVKVSARLPLSGLPFDTMGAGLTVGASKKIQSWLTLIGAASIQYQDLEASDFNATNLLVSQWNYDLFGGAVFDPGEPGGFYFSTGFRYSSLRIQYASHLESAMPATVIHASLNYKSRRGWEVYFFMSEEVPGWNEALEPDFTAGLGFSYSKPNVFVSGPPPERHE